MYEKEILKNNNFNKYNNRNSFDLLDQTLERNQEINLQ